MQHEILRNKPLLRPNGSLSEAGYAKKLILDYDRNAIKANKFRIKEWDYYLITNGHFAVALTVADNSYMGMDSISFLDFDNDFQHTNSPISLMTMGKLNMPSTSESGDVESYRKKHYITFKREADRRILHFHMDNFYKGKPIDGEIVLDDPKGDSMVIATPFEKNPLAFYYNQKINCLPAKGKINFNDKTWIFDSKDSFGVLDWGRGVWTYKNTWFWGSASGLLDGIPFGFNIGEGFGDTSEATENMIFYNHKAHKISKVHFNIPTKNGKDSFMDQWFFTSDDDRFKMIFTPVMNRASKTDLKVLCSDQNQVFGRFTGRVVLNDGTVLNIKNFFGFAEKVFNKW